MVSVTVTPSDYATPTKQPFIDGIPSELDATPATVADTDDASTASSAASSKGSGRRNRKGKKPRAEYQKQIDALKQWSVTLKEENEMYTQEYAKLKEWVMAAPVPGMKIIDLADDTEEKEPEDTPAAPKSRKIFGKKPRAEFQKEIDDIEDDNKRVTEENDRLKSSIADIQTWYSQFPVM